MWLIFIFLGFIVFSFGFSFFSSRFSDPYRDIFFVMGKPGSGKSTYFVNQILKYQKINIKLRKKGLPEWSIYTDTPLNIEGVRLFNPLDLAKCWPDEKSVMFIDEISLTWDARNFKKFDDGVSEFMKLHRHASVVVYAASQNFDCDKRIRDLCTHFMIVQKIGFLCLLRPVVVIFPIFTSADSDRGSEITSGYQYSKIWKWRLFYMPKCFKYFNSRVLPSRPPLPYTVLHQSEKTSDSFLEVYDLQPTGGASDPVESPLDSMIQPGPL